MSFLVVAAICLEFHKEDTSSSAVLGSSGFPVLWSFYQVAQDVAYIYLPRFVLSATLLFDYVSKFSGL